MDNVHPLLKVLAFLSLWYESTRDPGHEVTPSASRMTPKHREL
jgi:hypothetical protein